MSHLQIGVDAFSFYMLPNRRSSGIYFPPDTRTSLQ